MASGRTRANIWPWAQDNSLRCFSRMLQRWRPADSSPAKVPSVHQLAACRLRRSTPQKHRCTKRSTQQRSRFAPRDHQARSPRHRRPRSTGRTRRKPRLQRFFSRGARRQPSRPRSHARQARRQQRQQGLYHRALRRRRRSAHRQLHRCPRQNRARPSPPHLRALTRHPARVPRQLLRLRQVQSLHWLQSRRTNPSRASRLRHRRRCSHHHRLNRRSPHRAHRPACHPPMPARHPSLIPSQPKDQQGSHRLSQQPLWK